MINKGKMLFFMMLLVTITYTIDVDAKTICKRAATLHKEICQSESKSYFCSGGGYNINDTIFFGNLGEGDKLSPGDAFDCDVDGNGIYSDTERFYYLTTTDNNKASLLYYSNTYQGKEFKFNKFEISYNADGSTLLGPTTAIMHLPTKNTWPNVVLEQSLRNIKDENGKIILQDFNYNNNVARLLTYDEIIKACGNMDINQIGSLDNCNFIMENTTYTQENKTNDSIYAYGIWLENTYSEDTTSALSVNVYSRMISPLGSNSSAIGVRPVIEVNLDEIDKETPPTPNSDNINKETEIVEVEDTAIFKSKTKTILGTLLLISGLGLILIIIMKSKLKES